MSYERHGFEYAVLRVVPRVDRGEMVNAGVLLYCRPLRFLAARVALDSERVLALDPAADLDGIERALAAVVQICEQQPGAGSAGLQDIGRRFRWLTAPRSTVVQPGPVHTGLTSDPAAEADRLLAALVLRPHSDTPRPAHDLRD
ncbi:MAG: DUF3037 domain-containing protein [Streptosporangiaceae bacterium]